MDETTSTAGATGLQVDMALLLAADEAGVRLEIVKGRPTWEAHPGFRHQKAVDRIRATLRPPAGDEQRCGCYHYADIYIRFPDGSLKRPDVSIFCQEPPETDEAVETIPEAVIEVVSQGYEAKDLEIGPLFYLAQGVKDIVVFDPRTLLVLHMQKDAIHRSVSPVEIEFQCGCRCRI